MSQSPGTISNQSDMYDHLAPDYHTYSLRKIEYLEAVETIVIKNIPSNASTLLDIGAGDGTRAMKIADATNITDITLVEPCPSMAELCAKLPVNAVWKVSAEDLPRPKKKYDVILCLWNVLGHITNHSARITALKNMSDFLSENGLLFIDVNNRYNAVSYGMCKTIYRFLYDTILPSPTNGDVTFEWEINGKKIPAMGHFFTPSEMDTLFQSANLQICKRFIVNYDSGKNMSNIFEGQMLFKLKHKGMSQ